MVVVVNGNILFLFLLSSYDSIRLVDYVVLREKDPSFEGSSYESYVIYINGGTYY